MNKKLFVLLLALISNLVEAQDFTIAQNIAGSSIDTDIRGQIFSPSIQGDGTGTITSSSDVFLTSFNVVYAMGATKAGVLYIYSTLPTTTAGLDDGTQGVLVGQSVSRTSEDPTYTTYNFDYLTLDVNTTYYAVFREDVQLDFGSSTSEEGPYEGGKMLKNNGSVVAENNFTALKFIGKFSESIPANRSDVDALKALYNAAGGSEWTNSWDLEGDPRDWYGTTWQTTRVTRINLDHNNLKGSISPQVGNLSELTTINLSNNELTNSIPVEIGNLNKLVSLDVGSNKLTGSIPDEIGNLTNLIFLGAYFNQLDGDIPTSIGNLDQLITLLLYNNRLTGNIPAGIWSFDDLVTLNLANNQLEGSISSEVENLAKLATLIIEGNQLGGSIPSEIGNLDMLTILNLENNGLTGPIPGEIGNLDKLTTLRLNSNKLEGSIPSEIGNLINVFDLSFGDNRLTGTIPMEISTLDKLMFLSLNDNQLTGGLPTGIENLSDMLLMNLSNNQLTSIPKEMGSLSQLTTLYLNGNKIVSIPEEIGNLSNLIFLGLDHNQLNAIPSTIGGLGKLHRLTLHYNQLTTLPTEIGELSRLNSLELNDNLLTTLPTEIGEMGNLAVLTLDNNQLKSLPKGIGDLSSLTFLSLDDNQLADIPSEIANLSSLTSLYMKSNKLDFSSFEPVWAFMSEISDLTISPQAIIPVDEKEITATFGSSLTLTVSSPGENNQYRWFLNGNAVSELSSSPDYVITSLKGSDIGTYYCEITNTTVTALTLKTDEIVLLDYNVDFLSTPTLVTRNATALKIEARVNNSGTLYYIALPKGSTAPSQEQVIAGKDASGEEIDNAGNTKVEDVAKQFYIEELTPSTFYDIYLVVEDERRFSRDMISLGTSTIAGIEFVSNYPEVSSTNTTDVTISVNTTRNGTLYYVALLADSDEPTAEQVIAGTNASSEAAIHSGFILLTAESAKEFNISGLNEETSYEVYLVAKDQEGILTEVMKVSANTNKTITSLESNGFTPGVLSLYPNPAADVINIEVNLENTYDLRIVNIKGEEMLTLEGVSKYFKLDISHLQPGIYMTQIKTDKKSAWIRFIKN